MIPLGSGVQIVTDIPPETGAVIDIGSRVQAEKTLSEAIAILTKRTEEILEIMNKMKIEFNSIEETTISLANIFNEQINSLQTDSSEEKTEQNTAPPSPPTTCRPRPMAKRRHSPWHQILGWAWSIPLP